MSDSDVKKATDALKDLAPDYAQLTQDVLFGDVWNRPPLSQRDKSLITVTCLVALNRIEQVEFHLKKALENDSRRRSSRPRSRISRSTQDGRPQHPA